MLRHTNAIDVDTIGSQEFIERKNLKYAPNAKVLIGTYQEKNCDFMVSKNNIEIITEVIDGKRNYAFLSGDCNKILDDFPKESVDCVITSPPYWKQREYEIEKEYSNSAIGNEENPDDYVKNIVSIFKKIKTVLKSGGAVWLNIGDKYYNKKLMGMPWRVCLALQNDGWILRNDIIWNRRKGTQSSKDRFRNIYEHFFFFVKSDDYFFDYENSLVKPEKLPTYVNGQISSATGVSGKKYRKQIIESISLKENEKKSALDTLESVLKEMKDGKVSDFRMTIRGNQRTLHSNSKKISGRAKELDEKGFFVLKSYTKGFIPNDIWKIVPEDELRKDSHYAVFPLELLQIPIKSTCPKNGTILDPFAGTGSAILAANLLGRRGIGIEIGKNYLETAKKRLEQQKDN